MRRTTGVAPDSMMSARTCPGPTEGNWSMSPMINRPAGREPRAKDRHQHHIDHRRLVDDEQITFERTIWTALEPAGFRIDLQQPMDGLGLETRRLRHSLGGSAGGRAEQEFHALRGEDSQD